PVAFEHADPVGGIEGGDLGAELSGAAAQAAPLGVLLLGGHRGVRPDLLLLGGDQQVLGAQRGERLGALVGEGLVLELVDVVLDAGAASAQLLTVVVPPFDGTVQRALEAAGGVPLGQDPSTQLLAGAVGEAVPGMGAGLDTAQET